MGKKEYEEKTEALALPVIEAHRFQLVDTEWVKEGRNYYLRLYIDKPGGITIDDCETVSREFNEILDREDYIKEQYTFEVSSPGLDRPLKKDRDLEMSIGKDVEIKLYKAVNGEKEKTGTLLAWDGETVTIESFEGTEEIIKRSDISLIRLYFSFDI
ncbi:MAG: ribosome maturation factor RimP [Lachnospiraceae bacterium]|nr:ribosome maturation factor RimP [Lachnospiraceae bacterium]